MKKGQAPPQECLIQRRGTEDSAGLFPGIVRASASGGVGHWSTELSGGNRAKLPS